MEISFSELRSKTVVNLTDGRRLGHIIDLIFEQCGARILGVVVPGTKSGMFKGREDIFIPYQCICKIGFDTILVELNPVTPPPPVTAASLIGKYQPANTVVVEPETGNKARTYTTYTGLPEK
ncbi:MAG: YlmC/YmxH family sporulation protein [Clostridia bacterium]|nr:YlmC/YmxH family sporulation protein [Clostridia bacterium]